jgi:hypothetical protein
MKKLMMSAALLFSFQSFAETLYYCTDVDSQAMYLFTLNTSGDEFLLAPLVKDEKSLSLSNAKLKYNEGESGIILSVFEGKNENQVRIVFDIDMARLTSGEQTPVSVAFSQVGGKILNQEASLLCELE